MHTLNTSLGTMSMATAAIAMPPQDDRAAWLEARRSGLGASEIAAVLGLSTFRAPIDVFLEKRGRADDQPDTMYTLWGRLHEATIAKQYAVEFGVTLSEAETYALVDAPWARATPDRFVLAPNGDTWLLECKTTDKRNAHLWGESGTDELPMAYLTQAMWQMLVTGFRRCDIAVLIGGNDFRHYMIHFDEDLAQTMFDRARDFWFNHVLANVEPPITGPNADALLAKRYWSHSDEIATAEGDEGELVLRCVTAYLAAKDAESVADSYKTSVKELIGERKGIRADAGTITWSKSKDGTTTDWHAVAMELADELASVSEDASQRPGGAKLVLDTAATHHTTTKPGSRRFLVKPAGVK